MTPLTPHLLAALDRLEEQAEAMDDGEAFLLALTARGELENLLNLLSEALEKLT